MKLNLFQIVVMAAGATLLYAGISGNNPATVVKDILNNRSPGGNTAYLSKSAADATAAAAAGQDPELPTIFFTNGIVQEGGVFKGKTVANLKVLSN